MKTEKAKIARIKMGKETDTILFKHLKDNPSKTIYELSKDLDWSIGKVQKSVKRLDEKLVMEVDSDIGDGRIRKKYRSV